MNFLQSVNAVVKKQMRKVHSLSSPSFSLPFTPVGRGATSSLLSLLWSFPRADLSPLLLANKQKSWVGVLQNKVTVRHSV